ncbi:cobalamin biosynthesis protein CbiL [Thermodesulfobacteriota bacterium]
MRAKMRAGWGVLFMTLMLCLNVSFIPHAHAHRIYLFAWVEGDMVHTDSYFPNRKKVGGGRIEVFDEKGNRLLEGKTDEKGAFSFTPPQKTTLRIVLNASMGHKAEFTLSADEFSDGPQEKKAETPMNTSKAKPLTGAAMDREQVRIEIEGVLDQKLRPIIRALARIQEEKTPGFRDIIAGIGYIFGIMGLILYFKNRPKN